jgi:hypothetical protein
MHLEKSTDLEAFLLRNFFFLQKSDAYLGGSGLGAGKIYKEYLTTLIIRPHRDCFTSPREIGNWEIGVTE